MLSSEHAGKLLDNTWLWPLFVGATGVVFDDVVVDGELMGFGVGLGEREGAGVFVGGIG
jgi:hypothetical protein